MHYKNSAPFISRFSKINNVLIDIAEDVDVVMPMYNLIEYTKNYSKTTKSLYNFYRGEPNSCINNGINYFVADSKSFDYKTKLIESVTNANLIKQNAKTVVPLKHLSNF